jgi:murein DD-endopeptidase MepM/ murein hydrolase activator NlpD
VGDTPRRDPMGFDSGRSPYLVPLVWRSGDDQGALIEVAHHRRLRPVVDAEPATRKRVRAQPEDAPTGQTVTVKKGDTINSIARAFHTTPKAIMEANRTIRPKSMKPGDELQLPTSDTGAKSGSKTAAKTARGRHARQAEANTDTTADSGRSARGHKVKAGKPAGYVVKHGDTLYSIARRNGVTVEELRDLNRLRSNSLHSGQKLKLPGEVDETAVAERPSKTSRPSPSRRPPPVRETQPVYPAPSAAPPEPAPTPAPPPPASTGPSQPVPYSSLPGAIAPSRTPAYPPRPSASYPPTPAPSYSTPTPTPAPTYPAPSYPAPARPAPMPAAPLSEAPAAGPTDAQVAAAGKGRFIWPTRGSLINGFGPMAGGQRNDGLDIAATDGSPVRAAAAGDVVYAGNLVPGFGNLVLIKHEDGWVTAYAHLSNTEVKIRDHVAQGAEIGTIGSSGGVSQPQLHFEVRYAPSPRERARPIDPALVLPVGQ